MDNLAVEYLLYLGPPVHSFLIKECSVDSAALSANHCANFCFLSPPKMTGVSDIIGLEELLFWKITYSVYEQLQTMCFPLWKPAFWKSTSPWDYPVA